MSTSLFPPPIDETLIAGLRHTGATDEFDDDSLRVSMLATSVERNTQAATALHRTVERQLAYLHVHIERACEQVLRQGHGAVRVTTGFEFGSDVFSTVEVIDELEPGVLVEFATIYYVNTVGDLLHRHDV